MRNAEHELVATEEEMNAPRHDRFNFGDRKEVSDALLARLSNIGATNPRLVDTKLMQTSDARADQNKLEFPARSAISCVFTDAEAASVKTGDGLSVTAFDGQGRRYEMACKLWNGKHYRFKGPGWRDFLVAHGLRIPKGECLTEKVKVELWAFRSCALLPKDGGVQESSHRDGGALGLVVLLDKKEAEEFRELMAAAGLLKLKGYNETQEAR